jgi:ankyrin repeat protein
MSSIWAGHTSCTRALLSRGANVSIVCRLQKATALHVASMIGRSQDVTVLLQYGSDRYAKDASGRTAEHVAAACRMLFACYKISS